MKTNEATQFKPGNEIGKETRFKKGNLLSTKYKEEYAEKLIKYFKEYDGFPTIEGFAIDNDISVRCVKYWGHDEEEHPRFAFAYRQAIAIQKRKLLENGLADKYNAALTKFLLMNNHGMSDKSEQKVEGEANATITVNIREVDS